MYETFTQYPTIMYSSIYLFSDQNLFVSSADSKRYLLRKFLIMLFQVDLLEKYEDYYVKIMLSLNNGTLINRDVMIINFAYEYNY